MKHQAAYANRQVQTPIQREEHEGSGYLARVNSEGVTIVQIIDPVNGLGYLLDPYNHIAHRFSPEKANEPVRYSQEAHAGAQGAAGSSAAQAVKPSAARTNGPEVATESPGSQVIEGVSAEGQRTTTDLW